MRQYTTVMADIDEMSPRGTSRSGFLVSSAMVATMSKPVYDQYTTPAARNTPAAPKGKKDGARLPASKWENPAASTKAMMPMPTTDASELSVDVMRAPDTATAEVQINTTTAMGSSRLNPSASAGTWMRSASVSRPRSAGRG
uniref:Uncharacterized protein n=1 Tax=Oryza brachyantha TaxID=4533 RepID=J3MET3_ORYBR